MKDIIYLAIPYSWNPEKSFEIANKVAADLMLKGNIVFSPVSHSHPISLHMTKNQQLDHELWMEQDLPYLIRLCNKVYVVNMRNHNGLKRELTEARKHYKEVKLIDYES